MRTLAELTAYVRYMIDERTATFWTDAELKVFLNFEYKALASTIINSRTGWYETSGTVNTVAGQREVSVASNSNGRVLGLTYGDAVLVPRNRREFIDAGLSNTGVPTNFDVHGRKIWLYPVPDAVYALTIHYEYLPADLSSNTDEVDFPLGFEDLIALGTVIKALMKDRQSITDLREEYYARKKELLASLPSRQVFMARRGSRI